ncbi:MAG: two-component system response regulator [Opitutus sp.]|nr:two-component system response regulator [Opitutus sp.]
MKSASHRILLVDDNADDRFLTERVLRRILPAGSMVIIATCGNEAVDYLMAEGRFADRAAHPFPSLLITDLEMPDGDGFEVLAFMQGNDAWSVVPRIVFSSAARDDDVRTAFQLGASAYHEKPVMPPENEACLRRIIDYWSTCAIPAVDACGRLIISEQPGVRGARYAPPECDGKMRRVPAGWRLAHHHA